jgi:hypothetical protein
MYRKPHSATAFRSCCCHPARKPSAARPAPTQRFQWCRSGRDGVDFGEVMVIMTLDTISPRKRVEMALEFWCVANRKTDGYLKITSRDTTNKQSTVWF